MSLVPKKQITILAISSALSAFSLASIVNFTDPYKASIVVFVFFYLSLYLFCFSSLSLVVFGIKRWLWPAITINDLGVSVRQGAMAAAFLTLTTALQLGDILFWWLELSLILFFIFLEVFLNLKK